MLIPNHKPTEEQKEFVTNFMQKGWIYSREDFKGDYLAQYIGMLGQVVICDLLKLERPKNEGIDKGFDIEWGGRKWDIKVEIRTCWYRPLAFVHNLYAKQLSNLCDGYIFLSYNKLEQTFEICGYIDKEEFIKRAIRYTGGEERIRADGTAMISRGEGHYEIKQKYLYKLI